MTDTKPKRADKAKTKSRTAELCRIMMDGALTMDIEDYVREKEQEAGSIWHVGEDSAPLSYSQIMRYRQKAERMLESFLVKDREGLLILHQAQRARLYQMAVSQADTRAALAILDSAAKLSGLFPSERALPAGDGQFPSLSAMVQVLVQAERGQVTVTQTTADPGKPSLALVGVTDDERDTARDATTLGGSEKVS